MGNTYRDVRHSTPQDLEGRNPINSASGREALNVPGQDQPKSDVTTRLAAASELLNLGSQTRLIELFPMAAYAVRAPDGVIAWYNSRAAELWGRAPAIDDTDERFCGAYKLYHADGTHMAHCDTPVALACIIRESGTPNIFS
jgi:hypothetical protein